MKTKLNIVAALVLTSFAISGWGAEGNGSPHGAGGEMQQPIFSDFKDLKWEKILPDLGQSSPEISVLHVDPKTKATKLMIRTPKGIHIRKHWHSANETHTIIKATARFECDGKQIGRAHV